MATMMVVVADRAGARLLAYAGRGQGLALVRELANPDGRKRNREIDTDRPGRVQDRRGGAPHSLEREESPHERAAATFARDLAHQLEQARNRHDFEGLFLVAEPRFLGMIQKALDPVTAKSVRGTLGKDLAHADLRALESHLADAMLLKGQSLE